VSPAAVLSRSPYIGVHCPIANSTACDQVGLAVWLRRPAASVSATIAGRPLRLYSNQPRPLGTPLPGSVTAFVGYLRHAGIATRLDARPAHDAVRWWAPSPSNSPAPRVRLRIVYAGGPTVVTTLDVPLNSGWG
jgi:hypothetical protein